MQLADFHTARAIHASARNAVQSSSNHNPAAPHFRTSTFKCPAHSPYPTEQLRVSCMHVSPFQVSMFKYICIMTSLMLARPNARALCTYTHHYTPPRLLLSRLRYTSIPIEVRHAPRTTNTTKTTPTADERAHTSVTSQIQPASSTARETKRAGAPMRAYRNRARTQASAAAAAGVPMVHSQITT
ncbi:hypothetical protein GY45DRAFT_965705 [Cubamyces sp. BRFM 1775]|nr:hypothetical protein GY45DRAFT_965705 [Cubamyces sp. BRFM 1775]